METLLDTNFVLTCVKQRLDFFSLAPELFTENFEWAVPSEVLAELKEISERKGERIEDKESTKISLELLRLINPKEIKLGRRVVDDGIVDYLKKNPNTILATLDKNLKKRVENKIMSIKGKKNLMIS